MYSVFGRNVVIIIIATSSTFPARTAAGENVVYYYYYRYAAADRTRHTRRPRRLEKHRWKRVHDEKIIIIITIRNKKKFCYTKRNVLCYMLLRRVFSAATVTVGRENDPREQIGRGANVGL